MKMESNGPTSPSSNGTEEIPNDPG